MSAWPALPACKDKQTFSKLANLHSWTRLISSCRSAWLKLSWHVATCFEVCPTAVCLGTGRQGSHLQDRNALPLVLFYTGQAEQCQPILSAHSDSTDNRPDHMDLLVLHDGYVLDSIMSTIDKLTHATLWDRDNDNWGARAKVGSPSCSSQQRQHSSSPY